MVLYVQSLDPALSCSRVETTILSLTNIRGEERADGLGARKDWSFRVGDEEGPRRPLRGDQRLVAETSRKWSQVAGQQVFPEPVSHLPGLAQEDGSGRLSSSTFYCFSTPVVYHEWSGFQLLGWELGSLQATATLAPKRLKGRS